MLIGLNRISYGLLVNFIDVNVVVGLSVLIEFSFKDVNKNQTSQNIFRNSKLCKNCQEAQALRKSFNNFQEASISFKKFNNT